MDTSFVKSSTTRTAGGLFVFQSFVFRINEKLHNAKQGLALTTKATPQDHGSNSCCVAFLMALIFWQKFWFTY